MNDILIRGNVDLFERIVVNMEYKDADSDKGPRASLAESAKKTMAEC